MHAQLAHPFELGPNGAARTVITDSEAHHQQAIAVLIMTRTGERKMMPAFGLDDPVHRGPDPIAADEVEEAVRMFGPPVRVTDVRTEWASDTIAEVTVEFA